MRTFAWIFFTFAILAVTSAGTGSTPKKKAQEVEKPLSENRKKDLEKNIPITNAESRSAKKPSKKKNNNANIDIEKDLTTLLKEDKDKDDIPLQDKLTSSTDPIKLGQKINKMTNSKKKKALIAKLKKAWIQNQRSLPGKFYQAVYASVISAQKETAAASKDNQPQSIGKNDAKESNKLTKDGTNSSGKAGFGGTVINAKKLAQPDLLSIVLQRGESALPTVLPDVGKNFGKVTDGPRDALGKASSSIESSTGNVKRRRVQKD